MFVIVAKSQTHYPGQHQHKFILEDKLKPSLLAFDLGDVQLLDSRFTQNRQREIQWLLSINVQQLLHSFKTNAGLYSGLEGGYFNVKKLGGWESLDCDLRGHTTGHILSALALLYASTGDEKFKIKADSIVNELELVQSALDQNGYLSAFPQELIDRNINGKSVWAPWYTLHKIFAGLLDQYLYCDNKTALKIATGMSSWAYNKLHDINEETRRIMLRNEFGGINEVFFNLYAITANEHDKWLGNFFYHNETLDPLKDNKDILEGKHANTYIPKLIGLTRDAEIEGKSEEDSIAAFFWQTVINHHTFATGSNSDKEHFFKPDEVSTHLTGYTGESCNVYNMLKLTSHLFCHTGDEKYAEYYERALLNHILGQQDTLTGMIAYFLPMLPGAHKVYSTPDSSFWCCVGSGFENQAKYGEAIYYHNNDELFINLFIPSVLKWKQKGFQLKQETCFPKDGKMIFTVEEAPTQNVPLNIRYPLWAQYGAQLTINGKRYKINQSPGYYIQLNRRWKKGDSIELNFDMQLHAVPANDNPDVVAFAYGPVILAGAIGTKDFTDREPFSDPAKHNDYYTYDYHVPQDVNDSLAMDVHNLKNYIQPDEKQPLTFKTVKENIVLKPLYDIHRERYIVYWKLK